MSTPARAAAVEKEAPKTAAAKERLKHRRRAPGRVTLRGTARIWGEREAMERAAWAADGVFEVTNEIKVAA